MENSDLKKYQEAFRSIEKGKEKTGYFIHLAVYIVVNTFLMYQDYSSNNHFHWSFFPLFGWGIGLIFHSLGTFLWFDNEWDKKEGHAEKKAGLH